MEILLQGTGAADGIPAFFGDDRVSQFARRHGGKDVRTRSAALIDGHLKLDFGPDTWSQCIAAGVNPSDLSAVLLTHTHDDHLARNELQYALFPFTPAQAMPFPIFGNQMAHHKIFERYPDWPIEFHLIRSFEAFETTGYRITPIAAYHKLDEDSMNFLIEHGGKTLLYGTDTGYWQPETWEFLNGWRLDGLIIESTDGLNPTGYHGHLDLQGTVNVVTRLREMGVLGDQSPVVTTHHAGPGDLIHAELEVQLAKHRIFAGFDGMLLRL